MPVPDSPHNPRSTRQPGLRGAADPALADGAVADSAASRSGYTLPAEQGELPRIHTLPWRQLAEYLLVFGGVPWVLRQYGSKGVMFPVLISLTLLGFWLLYREGALNRSFLLRWPSPRKRKRVTHALGWVALGLPTLLVFTWINNPEDLFRFPLERPGLWALVMVAYPLISVVPQEVLFRVVFFHRYRSLFPSRTAMIAGSAVAFGWAHIIYGEWISVILSAIGGVVFGITWFRSRSLMLVALQHALFGQWVFTVGLGSYFYRGVGG